MWTVEEPSRGTPTWLLLLNATAPKGRGNPVRSLTKRKAISIRSGSATVPSVPDKKSSEP